MWTIVSFDEENTVEACKTNKNKNKISSNYSLIKINLTLDLWLI